MMIVPLDQIHGSHIPDPKQVEQFRQKLRAGEQPPPLQVMANGENVFRLLDGRIGWRPPEPKVKTIDCVAYIGGNFSTAGPPGRR